MPETERRNEPKKVLLEELFKRLGSDYSFDVIRKGAIIALSIGIHLLKAAMRNESGTKTNSDRYASGE